MLCVVSITLHSTHIRHECSPENLMRCTILEYLFLRTTGSATSTEPVILRKMSSKMLTEIWPIIFNFLIFCILFYEKTLIYSRQKKIDNVFPGWPATIWLFRSSHQEVFCKKGILWLTEHLLLLPLIIIHTKNNSLWSLFYDYLFWIMKTLLLLYWNQFFLIGCQRCFDNS